MADVLEDLYVYVVFERQSGRLGGEQLKKNDMRLDDADVIRDYVQDYNRLNATSPDDLIVAAKQVRRPVYDALRIVHERDELADVMHSLELVQGKTIILEDL